MRKTRASIKGIYGYVPDYVLTNSELEKLVDTNDEWITSRTGIKERRILKGEGLGTSYMAVKAVQGLLEKTNTDPAEIEMVICCTSTPDLVFPATANIVATQVGAVNAFGYDIQAACSGFLYGLVTGSQFIESGRLKKILVIGGDKMSSIIDYKDRATCIIFGDGAGAALLEADEEGNGLMDFWLRSDGGGEPHLHMVAGGSRKPASHETVDLKQHYVYQDGKTVYKFAVTNMAYAAEQVMKRNNLSGEDIAYLVPHQANKRIVDATAKSMGVEDEKVLMNIERYGNTTNGTIPLLLWDFEKQLKKGDNLIFAAFGGGFTWGAAYLKWAY
jgi:3-oxoacyl-[acyl-carrier-protein] synthase-3